MYQYKCTNTNVPIQMYQYKCTKTHHKMKHYNCMRHCPRSHSPIQMYQYKCTNTNVPRQDETLQVYETLSTFSLSNTSTYHQHTYVYSHTIYNKTCPNNYHFSTEFDKMNQRTSRRQKKCTWLEPHGFTICLHANIV